MPEYDLEALRYLADGLDGDGRVMDAEKVVHAIAGLERAERVEAALERARTEASNLRHGAGCTPAVACICGLVHLRAALARAPGGSDG